VKAPRRVAVGRIVGPVLIVAWTAVPLLWLVSLSLKGGDRINDGRFWPSAPTWHNYRTVFRTDLFTSALRNSIGISLVATVLSVVLATLAAYAIARLDFPGKKLILSVALAIAMFPTISLVGPLFDIWRAVGLYDTWLGLVIPYLSFTLPLSIWTLSAFFREIPWEMEQAAQVDGATPWQAFRHVTLPLLLPFIVVALIIRTIDALKAFDTIYVITQGGPGQASETINIFLYLQAFAFYNVGYASAVVVVFFAIIMLLAALLLWTRQRVRVT